MKKILIVYYSLANKNTEKVARAMARAVNADLRRASDLDPEEVKFYDLIGFGAGIYMMKHNRVLLEFAAKLPNLVGKQAFVFSTSGAGRVTSDITHSRLKELLFGKGLEIRGEFACRGYDSFGPLRFIGGINRGRPNAADLERAEKFIQNLVKTLA